MENNKEGLTNDLIRWSLQNTFDKYNHIVRRRIGLPDDIESIEHIRMNADVLLPKYLTSFELERYTQYLELYSSWFSGGGIINVKN